ncbi:phage integrase family protein [Burkholderia sp. S171]|uniref:phage integrase family protein n=1 Tax=Burkholderia sp. S171 TaxID=1641860 RepID=UPI00131B9459|nr:phage integrase family protein [Burkholderia sp. S171]
METHETLFGPHLSGQSSELPDGDALAALRSWYEGVPTRDAVIRYLPHLLTPGKSARGVLSEIRRQLIRCALTRHRDDLAKLFAVRTAERVRHARHVAKAIEVLRVATVATPSITDEIERWLPPRAVHALHAHGIKTLAELTLRIPRRKQWWTAIPKLGQTSAQQIEAFFAAHPALTERARSLIKSTGSPIVVPWENVRLPHEIDGSCGVFRAPRESCALDANNDYDAVQTWLSLHESPSTQRAYRKEAERLILWAIVERGRALSSLTTEDAIAYRAFLRRPTPRDRWVGPTRARTSSQWRPFTGNLAPRSVAYSLMVLGALYRWLIEQRYVLANPFSGVKGKGTERAALDASHAFTEGEWTLLRTIADGLEWSYGWKAPAAQRLRFVLDFGYATGLRASELVNVTLKDIRTDAQGDHWVELVGKGQKAGKVALPPLARAALERYLVERGLPVSPERWAPATALISDLNNIDAQGLSTVRLWTVLKRFFETTATLVEAEKPAFAVKLRLAGPHWMRHTHATHALMRGAQLTSVRDNLRHASISTTSTYLHSDEVERARQFRDAFKAA